MKKCFIITVVLLGIFFLPKDVFAQTTITMCNSGCDYKSFDEVEDAYFNNILTDSDLIIELGEGEYLGELNLNILEKLKIVGKSSESTVLIPSFNRVDDLVLENMKLINRENYSISFFLNNITLKDVIIEISNYYDDKASLGLNVNESVNINNVTLVNNALMQYAPNEGAAVYICGFSGYITSDVNINGFTINNSKKIPYGLIFDGVNNANINNLTVDNAMVGLYVHRLEYYGIDTSVIVNNSNLLNTTCSSFNITDNNALIYEESTYINNKNYQLVFQDNNQLNCAVASGNDTNTYISSNNIITSPLISHKGDEIDYDNLTNTIQNINNGTVDVINKYKGVITIEQGSSSPLKDAFDKDVDLSKEIIWTSKDDTISIIDLDNILGLKEGNTTITGISSDGLNEYEIEVTVIKNPVTNSSIYITIGICVILILGTIIYVIYKRRIDN